MRWAATVLAATLSGLAACTPVIPLVYTPARAIVPGPPSSVAAVTATDATGRDPYVLLDVPGAYGLRPIAKTRRPVANEVAAVFTTALQARGMLAATAPCRIRLTLHGIGGHTILGAHILDGPLTDDASAYVSIELTVTDQSGQVVYQDAVQDGRDLDTPVAARNAARLPALVQSLLNATVDRMLDRPALRDAITAARPP